MAPMEAGLLVLTSFVAGVVAHAVWQMHRAATQVGEANKDEAPSLHDEQGSASRAGHSSEVKHLDDASHSAYQPIPLPPSPALPPLLSTSSTGVASLSIPADVTISHPLSPSPSPNPGGHPSPMQTPNMLLTPPPEAWIGQPEETLAKTGATDSWGEAVDHIEGDEGEHI